MPPPAQDTTRKEWALPLPIADFLHSLPNDHPLQVALRTYALALSFALGPALLPIVTSKHAWSKSGARRLRAVLRREMGVRGFAFVMMVGVGGGAALKHLWDFLEGVDSSEAGLPAHGNGNGQAHARKRPWWALKDAHKTFIANAVSASLAFALLHAKIPTSLRSPRRPPPVPPTVPDPVISPSSDFLGNASPTLDLTLLLVVRAVDSILQRNLLGLSGNEDVGLSAAEKEEKKRQRQRLKVGLDALVFWACSARIMWCFFYEPERLPPSYNKWILSIANMDPRILYHLRDIRSGVTSYRTKSCARPEVIASLTKHVGYPAAYGDQSRFPAYGGAQATAAWKALGVPGRDGVGGLPCEIVHQGLGGGSCTTHAALRWITSFAPAMALYLPVHTLPTLLTQPRSLLRISRLTSTIMAATRSAAFLSTFVSAVWYGVCLTRTLVLARLFPFISFDTWDGPMGCTLAGSLLCGASIWIEQGHRRGEMALYVLPRALRACLPERWIRSGKRSVRYTEGTAFVLAASALLTAAVHRPDSLRGLSRWALTFVMSGPNAGFWKRKREEVPKSQNGGLLATKPRADVAS